MKKNDSIWLIVLLPLYFIYCIIKEFIKSSKKY